MANNVRRLKFVTRIVPEKYAGPQATFFIGGRGVFNYHSRTSNPWGYRGK